MTHIIFRMARELNQRSLMVDGTNAPWAKTLLGLSADRVSVILDEFHESQVSHGKRLGLAIDRG